MELKINDYLSQFWQLFLYECVGLFLQTVRVALTCSLAFAGLLNSDLFHIHCLCLRCPCGSLGGQRVLEAF